MQNEEKQRIPQTFETISMKLPKMVYLLHIGAYCRLKASKQVSHEKNKIQIVTSHKVWTTIFTIERVAHFLF